MSGRRKHPARMHSRTLKAAQEMHSSLKHDNEAANAFQGKFFLISYG
jgi:hypothetical protein